MAFNIHLQSGRNHMVRIASRPATIQRDIWSGPLKVFASSVVRRAKELDFGSPIRVMGIAGNDQKRFANGIARLLKMDNKPAKVFYLSDLAKVIDKIPRNNLIGFMGDSEVLVVYGFSEAGESPERDKVLDFLRGIDAMKKVGTMGISAQILILEGIQDLDMSDFNKSPFNIGEDISYKNTKNS